MTQEFSDWSIVPLQQDVESLWLRVSRKGTTIEVHYSLNGENYQMLRQAYLMPVETIDVGLFCASPVGQGFTVQFEGLKVRDLQS